MLNLIYDTEKTTDTENTANNADGSSKIYLKQCGKFIQFTLKPVNFRILE